MKKITFFLLLFHCLFYFEKINAQQITGYWKGKIDKKNVEIKIVKSGDSLTGTSYYYESANSYRRYSIKGYFNPDDNSAVWWDDQLIEEKKGKTIFPAAAPAAYLSTADFNCPGGNKMFLNGQTSINDQKKGPINLQNTFSHTFNDEWDFVIDNYIAGTNDPEFIDSIGKLAFSRPIITEKIPAPLKAEKSIAKTETVQPKKTVFIPAVKKTPIAEKTIVTNKESVTIAKPLSIEK